MGRIKAFLSKILFHPYICLISACLLSALIFDFSADGYDLFFILFFGFAAVFLGLLCIFWYKKQALTEEKIVFLIFAFSFLIKLAYVMSTGLTERQHDIGTFREKSYSHAGYIYRLFTDKALPESTIGQYYHPPLHYTIEVLWLKLITLLGVSFEKAVHYVTLPTLFYSCVGSLLSYKIFKELNFGKTAVCVCTSLVAFHPTFIILSASYNNDILSITLLLLAMLYLIKWCKDQTFKNIVMIALGIGLGMMAKLTAAEIAPAVAVIFLIVFIKSKKKKKLFGEFLVFGSICVPLGLWHSLYMLFRFNRPIGTAMLLSPKLPQYVGFRSVSERLFCLPQSLKMGIYMLRGNQFGNTCYEYNIPSAVIKTSVFGEWHIGEGFVLTEILAYAMIIINIIIIAISLYCMIKYIFVKIKEIPFEIKLGIYLIYATIIGMYIKFCFDYAHDCSMDFRYIVPTAVIGTVFIGVYLSNGNSRAHKVFGKVIASAAAVFTVVSAMLFLLSGRFAF